MQCSINHDVILVRFPGRDSTRKPSSTPPSSFMNSFSREHTAVGYVQKFSNVRAMLEMERNPQHVGEPKSRRGCAVASALEYSNAKSSLPPYLRDWTATTVVLFSLILAMVSSEAEIFGWETAIRCGFWCSGYLHRLATV